MRCQTISSAIRYRFSLNFACGSTMWFLPCLLSLRQNWHTCSTLQVFGFRTGSFEARATRIFVWSKNKLTVTVNKIWNKKWDFRDTQIPVLFLLLHWIRPFSIKRSYACKNETKEKNAVVVYSNFSVSPSFDHTWNVLFCCVLSCRFTCPIVHLWLLCHWRIIVKKT